MIALGRRGRERENIADLLAEDRIRVEHGLFGI
jgi:hypothetical protein